MKKILIPALVLSVLFVQAQRTYPSDYKHAIVFLPMSLVNIDYTLMAGYEYKFNPKLSLVSELGYILGSSYMRGDEQNSTKASGFIIRPALRFYMNTRNNFYFQAQVFYKVVTHPMNDWLGKNCVDGVPAYEQLEDFKYRRKITGVNGIVGWLLPLSRGEKSYLDLYFGLGARNKNAKLVDKPNCCYERNGWLFGQ